MSGNYVFRDEDVPLHLEVYYRVRNRLLITDDVSSYIERATADPLAKTTLKEAFSPSKEIMAMTEDKMSFRVESKEFATKRSIPKR